MEANRIVFATRQLESLTTYELKASTRELILDVATGVSFETTSDVLVTFTTKEYNPTAGEVVYPVDSLMPVKGVHEVPVREGGRGVAEHAVGGSFSAVR